MDELEIDPTGEAAGRLWELGDYGRISDLLADLGPAIVAAAGVESGMRVLDVAAGTGNATIPAARRGADVVATDIAPGLLERAASAAAAAGLDIATERADAQDLPFADGSFDVVMSCIGAIFAPDHRRVAGELTRVCRPGGTIAMANWALLGAVKDFFDVAVRFTAEPPEPPEPPAESPLAWGDPAYVADLFGARVEELRVENRLLTLAFDGTPRELADCYRTCFPSMVAAFAAVRDDPAQSAAFDAALLDFFTRENKGPADGPGRYEYEYLLVIARRATD